MPDKMRIKFRKGEQRKFIKIVLEDTNCPSLRELINRGFDIPYSTLKNYYSEQRNLPENLFNDLLNFARLNKSNFDFEILEENFGKIIGGKKSQKNGPAKN